jgi:hypothetical protein
MIRKINPLMVKEYLDYMLTKTANSFGEEQLTTSHFIGYLHAGEFEKSLSESIKSAANCLRVSKVSPENVLAKTMKQTQVLKEFICCEVIQYGGHEPRFFGNFSQDFRGKFSGLEAFLLLDMFNEFRMYEIMQFDKNIFNRENLYVHFGNENSKLNVLRRRRIYYNCLMRVRAVISDLEILQGIKNTSKIANEIFSFVENEVNKLDMDYLRTGPLGLINDSCNGDSEEFALNCRICESIKQKLY